MTRCKRCMNLIEFLGEVTIDLWLGYGGDSFQILEGEYCSTACMKAELEEILNRIPKEGYQITIMPSSK